jgi:hypothetical protein
MMARHGIDQASLGGAEAKAKIGDRITQNFYPHQTILASAAATLYGCRPITYRTGSKHTGLEFIGRPENIGAAEDTFFWLMSQVENLYKDALLARTGMTQKQRSEFRKTFKEHCALRVFQRAKALIEEMQRNEQAASSTGSTALVVRGHFEKLAAEVEDVMKGMQLRAARPRVIRHGSGSAAGYAAGDRVQLRKEIR